MHLRGAGEKVNFAVLFLKKRNLTPLMRNLKSYVIDVNEKKAQNDSYRMITNM